MLALLVLVWTLAAPTYAHEVRPAYLEIRETPQAVDITWKQPVAGDMALPIIPHLSSGWLERPTRSQALTETSLIHTWRISGPHAPLAGQTLTVEGLDRSITDALVQVDFVNGDTTTHVVRPDAPRLVIRPSEGAGAPVLDYLRLGITHIWLGFDHLLYVFGLVLLAPQWRRLLATVTAFTVAHSLTLAAAVFRVVVVSPPAVEAVIALSIVYVAAELVRVRRGEPSLASRAPWIVAFIFGLLHGLGFASALREVGLPAGQVPMALLLFNVGIEAGQLVFVALVLASLWLLARSRKLSGAFLRGAPYLVGSLGAFWMIQRLATIVGG
ncbi:MAG: HupE/UreJ family protein [Caulobacteraceae bacterium]